MTVLNRLLISFALCSCGVAACFAVAQEPKPAEEAIRANAELCAEVTHELVLAVRAGLISEEHAQAIIARCYE